MRRIAFLLLALPRLALGAGQFVLVGCDNNVTCGSVTSPDGTTWTQQGSFTGTAVSNVKASIALAVNTTGSLYVLVYTNTSGPTARFFTSTNGQTWTSRSAPNNDTYRDVIFAKGNFIAIADSSIFYSADGITWNAASGNGGSPRALATNGNRAVYLSQHGATTNGVWYSDNGGQTWTQGSGLPAGNWRCATWTGSRFLAVGYSTTNVTIAAYAASGDIDWSSGSSATNLNQAFFNAGRCMAWDGSTARAVNGNVITTLKTATGDTTSWNSGGNAPGAVYTVLSNGTTRDVIAGGDSATTSYLASMAAGTGTTWTNATNPTNWTYVSGVYATVPAATGPVHSGMTGFWGALTPGSLRADPLLAALTQRDRVTPW